MAAILDIWTFMSQILMDFFDHSLYLVGQKNVEKPLFLFFWGSSRYFYISTRLQIMSK